MSQGTIGEYAFRLALWEAYSLGRKAAMARAPFHSFDGVVDSVAAELAADEIREELDIYPASYRAMVASRRTK